MAVAGCPRFCFPETDNSPASRSCRTGRGGGSNYTMVDGSARLEKWGRTMSPRNLWAVLLEYRNIALAPQ